MLELGEQPPLLQSARRRRLAHLPLQDQRLGLRHLPDHGVDRVVPQPTQHLDAQMAVDDDVAVRLLGVRHHHDGLLLAVLIHRRQQPTLTLGAAGAQRAVAQLQLVKLQLHDDSSADPGDGANHRPRLPLSLKPRFSPLDGDESIPSKGR